MRPPLLVLPILVLGCQATGDPVGAAGAGELFGPCGSTGACGAGLRCHRGACISDSGTIAEVGEPCEVVAQCGVPLLCAQGACADPADDPVDPGQAEAPPAWDRPSECDLEYPYGFVSLITGPVAIVDLCSCNRDGDGRLEAISQIGQGSMITHGVGVDHRRGEIWYGNQGSNSLQRLKLSRDLRTYEVLAQWTIAAGLSTIRRSPNGRYIATGAAEPQMVPPGIDEFAKNRAMFLDTGLNKLVGYVQTASPGSVFFSADSTVAWIPDINDRQVAEVHLGDLTMEAPGTPVHRLIPLPWLDDRENLVGPSPFLDQTSDYRWIAVPGLDAERVWIFDVQSRWEMGWEYATPGERPHMAAWEPDGRRLWVVTFTRWPTAGGAAEASNPSIPAYIHVVDAETHERIARFQWSPAGKNTAVWHVEITPDAGRAWLSGSYGSIVGFDLDSFEPVCSVSLHSGPRPAMVLDY